MYSNCAITFNNVNLDKYLKGYMTINVEGRQLFSPSLESVNIPGKNGDYFLSKSYPARDIKVYFLVQAKRNSEFLKLIKRLTELIQTDSEVQFSFRDEDGFRYGQVASIEDPPYDSNIGVGSFTIHTSDPFIYSSIRETSGKIPSLEYKKYPIKLEEMIIVCEECKKLVITNISNGQKIILNGALKKGDELKITSEMISLNGRNILHYLDFVESDYHEFTIYSEDEIRASAGKLNIRYRERAL